MTNVMHTTGIGVNQFKSVTTDLNIVLSVMMINSSVKRNIDVFTTIILAVLLQETVPMEFGVILL